MTFNIRNLKLIALTAAASAGLAAGGVAQASIDTGSAASVLTPVKPDSTAASKNSAEFDQAVIALKSMQLDQAEKLFKQAALKQPKSPAPLIGLAEIARARKNDAEVERLLRKAIDVDPKNAQTHLVMGSAFYSRGRLGDTEAEFLKAAELAPKSVAPLMALADLYLNVMKRPDKAAEYFGKVIQLSPGQASAHLGLGMSDVALHDFAAAETSLNKARSLAPSSPLPLMALAQLQGNRSKPKEAVALLQQAADLAPTMEDIPLRMGIFYQQLKQWNDAYAAYEKALRLNSKLVVAYNNLAWMAADRKERLDDAERWGAKAVELVPNEPSLKDTYAWVKRARGDNKAALALLESITVTGNPRAEFFYHLAIVREELGQKPQAAAAYKRALEINPQFGQAEDAKQRLGKLQ
ncbi:tetratricopeptide repeat protein [Undibacterium sp. TJN25]|uniref:tetratricopeptide repeat protein n=1 Tax=Undibacterium sp. TJN25 TaxID=3413056 RepID=UPI003BF01372